jgi:hypothetical protein
VLPGSNPDVAAEAARVRFGLAPSAAFPALPGRVVLARLESEGYSGWTLGEDGASEPAAWLSRIDHETWVAAGVTGDDAWTFAPAGRHRPDLGAWDPSGQPAAACRRGMRRGQRIVLPGLEVRMRPPNFPLRPIWRLTTGEGTLARIRCLRQYVLVEMDFRWQRTPPNAALVSLMAAYSLIIEYTTNVSLPSAGSGG